MNIGIRSCGSQVIEGRIAGDSKILLNTFGPSNQRVMRFDVIPNDGWCANQRVCVKLLIDLDRVEETSSGLRIFRVDNRFWNANYAVCRGQFSDEKTLADTTVFKAKNVTLLANRSDLEGFYVRSSGDL